MGSALGSMLGAETGFTDRDIGERESALLCCMAENWTEEGEL
jgi:hypothetical protein